MTQSLFFFSSRLYFSYDFVLRKLKKIWHVKSLRRGCFLVTSPTIRPSINIASERLETCRRIAEKPLPQESHNGRGASRLYHKQDCLGNFARPGTVFVSKYISIVFATLQFTALNVRRKRDEMRDNRDAFTDALATKDVEPRFFEISDLALVHQTYTSNCKNRDLSTEYIKTL